VLRPLIQLPLECTYVFESRLQELTQVMHRSAEFIVIKRPIWSKYLPFLGTFSLVAASAGEVWKRPECDIRAGTVNVVEAAIQVFHARQSVRTHSARNGYSKKTWSVPIYSQEYQNKTVIQYFIRLTALAR
jgi:hypothetical protein